jgi:hypothetical protein
MLEEWLGKNFRTPVPEPLQEAIGAFKKVRELRQKPAHAVNEDDFDKTLLHRQRELMIKAYDAVRVLRLCLANHPLAKSVEVRQELHDGQIWTC